MYNTRLSYTQVCIHSNATVNFHFSADDLVSCCHTCGFGCNGGFPGAAWSYWTHKGIVSGGSYGSKDVSHFIHEYTQITYLTRQFTGLPSVRD